MISLTATTLFNPRISTPPVPMSAGNPPTSKASEATPSGTNDASHPDAPPAYTSPPRYQAIATALSSLAHGPPDETISVPMVHRKDSKSLHRLNPFSRKGYETCESYITARQMKREQYLKHYAKDAEGRFVGTGAPAPDAGLVFVAGKGTDEDLLRQVEEVALGMQMGRGEGIGKFGKPL